jgi:hypothetical protein
MLRLDTLFLIFNTLSDVLFYCINNEDFSAKRIFISLFKFLILCNFLMILIFNILNITLILLYLLFVLILIFFSSSNNNFILLISKS